MKDIMMEKYHIIPRKTYDGNFTFPLETVPQDLFRHFIRGYLDGDGTINESDIRFVFNSKNFAEQIISFFKEIFDINNDTVEDFSYTLYEIQGKTTTYYRLRLPSGKGRRKLYESVLYKDATFFLQRKRNKFYKRKNNEDIGKW